MTGRPSSLTMMTGTCWFIPRASTCSTITDVAFMKRDHKSAGITPPTNVSLRTTGVTKAPGVPSHTISVQLPLDFAKTPAPVHVYLSDPVYAAEQLKCKLVPIDCAAASEAVLSLSAAEVSSCDELTLRPSHVTIVHSSVAVNVLDWSQV